MANMPQTLPDEARSICPNCQVQANNPFLTLTEKAKSNIDTGLDISALFKPSSVDLIQFPSLNNKVSTTGETVFSVPLDYAGENLNPFFQSDLYNGTTPSFSAMPITPWALMQQSSNLTAPFI